MPSIQRVISLDTECTGVDNRHGCRPYLVTTCDERGRNRWWHWQVDPLTRRVMVVDGDVKEIQATVDAADVVAMHNSIFDVAMLHEVGVHVPWGKVRDTLIASHLLASNHPHNLTDTAAEHLGKDVGRNMGQIEVLVEAVTKRVLKGVKANEWQRWGVDTSRWRLAKEDMEDMPSVNNGGKREEERAWKADMWTAQAVADALHDSGVDLADAGFDPEWLRAVVEYANADSAVTLPLWLRMEWVLNERKLGKIFAERMRLCPIARDLKNNGVTAIGGDTESLLREYGEAVDLAQAECLAVADRLDFPLELPAGASPNDSVREFMWGSVRLECPRCGTNRLHKHWVDGEVNGQVVCPRCLNRKGRWVKDKRSGVKVLKNGPVRQECAVVENDCLRLPTITSAKTGRPTLDADAMEEYRHTLEPGPALEFIEHLCGMRSRQTAVSYMQGYRRHWLPTEHAGYYRLHSSVNPTGTNHLRWVSSNPNSQNISRKEGFNLRRCFGPAPGREWWSMDFRSIEARIPAYESGEPKMVEVFEKPDTPPYWGNLYYLTASVVYPDEFWEVTTQGKDAFKKGFPTMYKRAKFFVLAKQYGCGRRKGDLLTGVPDSFDKVDGEFPLLAALQQKYLDMARRLGYVETIPDREVYPERGYPILVGRGEDGDVSTTQPFNYHISGTAMQCTNRAMVKTEAQVKEWNAEGWDGFLTLQVHDELVWDCPAGVGEEPWQENLWRMDALKELMESVGQGIGMPTPTSREYHSKSYAVGLSV